MSALPGVLPEHVKAVLDEAAKRLQSKVTDAIPGSRHVVNLVLGFLGDVRNEMVHEVTIAATEAPVVRDHVGGA